MGSGGCARKQLQTWSVVQAAEPERLVMAEPHAWCGIWCLLGFRACWCSSGAVGNALNWAVA